MNGRQTASCRLEVVGKDGVVSNKPWGLRRVWIRVQDGFLSVFTTGRIQMEFMRLNLKSIREFGYHDNTFYLVSDGVKYRFSRIFPWRVRAFRRILDNIYDTSDSPPDNCDFMAK